MPLNTQMTRFAVEIQADVLAKLLDGGFVDVMSGEQPESADDPITTQRVLATMSFGKPAFLPAQDGVLAANTLSAGIGVADGDPRWFRTYRADHKTAVFDGSAGKGKDFNMVLPAKTIIAGITVGCSGLVHTVRKSMIGI